MRTGQTLLLLTLCIAPAYSQLATPRAGIVRYQDGIVHELLGVHGNYVVGGGTFSGAAGSAFSDNFGFVSTGTTLQLLGADGQVVESLEATEPHPILNVGESENSAIAWLPSQSVLVHRTAGGFVSLPLSGVAELGAVTSVTKRNEQQASLLVATSQGELARVTVELKSGATEGATYLVGARGVGFEFDRSIVSFIGGVLSVTAEDTGSPLFEARLGATRVTLERASSSSLHIASLTDSRNWLLYSNKHGFEVAELPPARSTQ